MPVAFQIPEQIIGFAAETAGPGDQVNVIFRETVSAEAYLFSRMEQLQLCVFRYIPDFPRPSAIDHLLVVIHPSLQATAYINELTAHANLRTRGDIAPGAMVFVNDVEGISAVDLGVTVPDDAACVVIRSFGWRKSLFFDFGPLHAPPVRREAPLPLLLAQQGMELLGLAPPAEPLNAREDGLRRLRQLLDDRCEEERSYQDLLELHSWIFAGQFSRILRHRRFDDRNIPDFTGVRTRDRYHDIIELKQPFLSCFRSDGDFAGEFNDAWNQAERYLAFARDRREYLREEKQLSFENPTCWLVLGYRLDEAQLRLLHRKERMNPQIKVLTYDGLLAMADAAMDLMYHARGGVRHAGVAGAS